MRGKITPPSRVKTVLIKKTAAGHANVVATTTSTKKVAASESQPVTTHYKMLAAKSQPDQSAPARHAREGSQSLRRLKKV